MNQNVQFQPTLCILVRSLNVFGAAEVSGAAILIGEVMYRADVQIKIEVENLNKLFLEGVLIKP